MKPWQLFICLISVYTLVHVSLISYFANQITVTIEENPADTTECRKCLELDKTKETHTISSVSSHVETRHQTESELSVWPSLANPNDRIIQQMNLGSDTNSTKIIFLASRFNDIGVESKVVEGCPVSNCRFTSNRAMSGHAHALVAKGPERARHPDQIVVWYQLESPKHSSVLQGATVNWTATYRSDSTLTAPYYRFQQYPHYKMRIKSSSFNYAKGKFKMVAWFVSNCGDKNGRLKYAHELQKYVQVDIYGSCGKLRCSRFNGSECFQKLDKEYKFYLSFENSNCRDYITEKFFLNGLSNNVVPVVMGARPEDYAAVAPPHSYIHVDDFPSPRHLADYLKLLDANDTLYNEYFAWKGTGEFINTKFWCRLCAMVHEAHASGVRMWYDDLKTWWSGPGECLLQEMNHNDKWVSWRNSSLTHAARNSSIVHLVGAET